MLIFEKSEMQTLNVMLQKSNYQKITQKINFLLRRVVYFQLLQRCKNVAICENALLILLIDFMMTNTLI